MRDRSEDVEDRVYQDGGLEEKLDVTAWVVFGLAVLAGGLLILVGQHDLGWLGGLMVMLNGWVFWLLLHGLAELVRLGKKANGLPYSGRISGTREMTDPRCPDCGELLHGDNFCGRCQKRVPDEA